jgi:hypothetical protein
LRKFRYKAKSGQMGEKFSDLGFRHFPRMTFPVVQNEPAYQIAVGPPCAKTKTFPPDDVTDLSEEFRLVAGGGGR